MSAFRSLSESEMEIMQVIWTLCVPVTTGKLLNLFAYRGWKIQTLSTFLTRLAEKGVLSIEKQGKTNRYTPALTQAEYRAREARYFIESMYHGSLPDFLTDYYGAPGLSPEDAADLRQWLIWAEGHE